MPASPDVARASASRVRVPQCNNVAMRWASIANCYLHTFLVIIHAFENECAQVSECIRRLTRFALAACCLFAAHSTHDLITLFTMKPSVDRVYFRFKFLSWAQQLMNVTYSLLATISSLYALEFDIIVTNRLLRSKLNDPNGKHERESYQSSEKSTDGQLNWIPSLSLSLVSDGVWQMGNMICVKRQENVHCVLRPREMPSQTPTRWHIISPSAANNYQLKIKMKS